MLLERGYEESSENVNQGGNSITKRLKRGDDDLCLKIYNEVDNQQGRRKATTEAKFLKFLTEQGITNAPKHVESSSEGKWIIMTWIEGNPVEKAEKRVIKSAVEFIKASNSRKNTAGKLDFASEACINPNIMVENIKIKLRRVENQIANNSTEECLVIKRWIDEELKKHIQDVENKARMYSEQDIWSKNRELIASPSDVGIHNILVNKDHEYFFYDFEHAGIDEIAKFACDWNIRPENNMTVGLERYLLDEIEKSKIISDSSWIDRYEQMKNISKLAWCIIYMKRIIKNNKSTEMNSLKERATKLFLTEF